MEGGKPRMIQLPSPRGGGGMLVVAHRGNKVVFPENTHGAFRQAIEEGADLIETDIRISSEGVFICFHDECLERMTDGRGRMQEKSVVELKQLRVRGGDGQWSGERIATLEEFARLLPDDVAAALELKDSRFADRATCAAFVDVLDQLGLRRRTIILGSSSDPLKAIRDVAPDLPVGRVTFSPWPARNADLLGPPWPILLINPFYVHLAHRKGLIVCPLDPKPDRLIRLYRFLGCDALLTDNPASTLKILRRTR